MAASEFSPQVGHGELTLFLGIRASPATLAKGSLEGSAQVWGPRSTPRSASRAAGSRFPYWFINLNNYSDRRENV